MAQERGQDIIKQLADRGGDAIGRITELPGAQKLVESANQLKERVDELQRRMRGLDALERRVDKLEKKVHELSRAVGSDKGRPKRTTQAKPKPKPPS